MLVQITNTLTNLELEFLSKTLEKEDAVLYTDQAIHLSMQALEFPCKTYVRSIEAEQLGLTPDDNCTWVTERDWVQLTVSHEKTITW